MSTDSASGDFTRMLDDTVKALRTLSSAGAASADETDGEEDAGKRGVGETADGAVRAEFGTDGRLSSIWIHPRLTRLASVDLAEQVMLAVNAAIDSMRGGVTPPDGPGDLSRLTEQLEQVRDSAVPRLSAFIQSLTEAQDRLARGKGPR